MCSAQTVGGFFSQDLLVIYYHLWKYRAVHWGKPIGNTNRENQQGIPIPIRNTNREDHKGIPIGNTYLCNIVIQNSKCIVYEYYNTIIIHLYILLVLI